MYILYIKKEPQDLNLDKEFLNQNFKIMKKQIIFISALILVFSTSCEKEKLEEVNIEASEIITEHYP